LTDRDILEDWLRSKKNDIESKNSNLVVGHKDILIET
jgi:hypothetical protein